MPETLTHADYVLAEHLGAAGSAAALSEATRERWHADHPGWQGKHWAYSDPDEHTARHLHPINVAPRPKKQH
ncbi:hypothetical protein [Nocardia transvalensis]|uniref:hypothetical protein n=1 Tax=Nocardia transvalensis TaxID=37333 RepID=UPI001895DC6A|nr:hypothetical protein [Nocardia transvalensis]MBF6331890.1 hypothetical protein [Nocardia transvalensis]